MSLKCSVFGHRFGDADVTREREEQGSEVVITITETETCERCGETRVVSENKEVTTLETPSDIVGDDVGEEGGGDEGVAEGSVAGEDVAGEGVADEGVTGEVGGEDRETVEAPAPEASGESDPPAAGSVGSPAEEDAELIDEAEGSETADSPDEPPTGDAAGGATGPSTPDLPAEEDAVILEDDSDTDEEERAPGEWPQETDEDENGDDWVPETEPGELEPVENEQPDLEPTGEAVTVPDGEFHCPECDFSTAVESSSLREGDFCPECHRGVLARRSGES